MVIDTSALIAVLLREPLREALLDVIVSSTKRVVSSVSLLEAGIVLRARFGGHSVHLLYELTEELATEIAAFDEVQARLAVAAFDRFGKGMGTGRNLISETARYMHWPYCGANRFWPRAPISPRPI